jgi:hypothetical protein
MLKPVAARKLHFYHGPHRLPGGAMRKARHAMLQTGRHTSENTSNGHTNVKEAKK